MKLSSIYISILGLLMIMINSPVNIWLNLFIVQFYNNSCFLFDKLLVHVLRTLVKQLKKIFFIGMGRNVLFNFIKVFSHWLKKALVLIL